MADNSISKALLFSVKPTTGRESCGVSMAGWGKGNIVLKKGDALDNMTL